MGDLKEVTTCEHGNVVAEFGDCHACVASLDKELTAFESKMHNTGAPMTVDCTCASSLTREQALKRLAAVEPLPRGERPEWVRRVDWERHHPGEWRAYPGHYRDGERVAPLWQKLPGGWPDAPRSDWRARCAPLRRAREERRKYQREYLEHHLAYLMARDAAVELHVALRRIHTLATESGEATYAGAIKRLNAVADAASAAFQRIKGDG